MSAMFDRDEHNLRKIRTHLIGREEVEQALSNDPILIYEQTVQEEVRYVYYGESEGGRLLALVVARAGPSQRRIPPLRLPIRSDVKARPWYRV